MEIMALNHASHSFEKRSDGSLSQSVDWTAKAHLNPCETAAWNSIRGLRLALRNKIGVARKQDQVTTYAITVGVQLVCSPYCNQILLPRLNYAILSAHISNVYLSALFSTNPTLRTMLELGRLRANMAT